MTNQKYDAMAAFRKASEKQKGLPMQESTIPKEDIPKTEELEPKKESPRLEKTEEKGQALQNAEATVNEDFEEDSDYAYEEDEDQNWDEPNEESKSEASAPQNEAKELSKQDKLERKRSLERLRGTTSKVLVSQGDRLQATLATVIFDWRGETGLQQAQKHRDLLLKKVTQGSALSEGERNALRYAQDYIQRYEVRKDSFEENINLSPEDKEELIELLGDYLETSSYEPSPLLIIAGIIGVTLFTNLYTAFTAHPKYNPPW